MRKTLSPLLPACLLSLLFLATQACGPRNGVADRTPAVTRTTPRITTLVTPSDALTIPIGERVEVTLSVPDTVEIDSLQLFVGGELRNNYASGEITLTEGQWRTTVSTAGELPGGSGLRLRIFFAGGGSENQRQKITFLSDIEPVEYSYRVVEEYPHDVQASTQGLVYRDGWLYEGTGGYGTSSLRKVELSTGEVKQIRSLDPDLFGEGVAIFEGQIYQLTYKAQVGFIYDLETFEEIRRVYYQNREGWGLTHNGEELIMSDGTHVIYFLDPELFTVNRQIEVYDNEGRSTSLNELEYIDGKIWANRFYTDQIVIIDPLTGKVEGRINLKGILKASDRSPDTDVLNGIALDEENNRVFVTGKRWPKLFHIRLES